MVRVREVDWRGLADAGREGGELGVWADDGGDGVFARFEEFFSELLADAAGRLEEGNCVNGSKRSGSEGTGDLRR